MRHFSPYHLDAYSKIHIPWLNAVEYMYTLLSGFYHLRYRRRLPIP
jgi:hypothetical protein